MDMLERGLLHFKNISMLVLDRWTGCWTSGRGTSAKIWTRRPSSGRRCSCRDDLADIEKLAAPVHGGPEKVIVQSRIADVSLVEAALPGG